jgi:hypothetical protein
MEREADEDFAAGRHRTFDNAEDFLSDSVPASTEKG